MLYKPTYCCDCGDRIERSDWKILTSRRFCNFCETEHKFDDLVRKFTAGGLVLLGVFGVGSYFSNSEKSIEITNPRHVVSSTQMTRNPVSLVGKRKGVKELDSAKREIQGDSTIEPADEASANRDLNTKPASPDSASKVHEKRVQKVRSEPVYFCGAATKKGKACSRRVKGGGRCWQHKGKEAILAESKLLIKK